MMRISWSHTHACTAGVALTFFVALEGRVCEAQDLPSPDPRFGTLSIASRDIWRAMTLADAISVQALVAIPVFGTPEDLNGLQVEGRSWNPIENRSRFRIADQYTVTARYLNRIGPKARQDYLSLSYTEIVTPNAQAAVGEVELGASAETGFPSLGIPSIRFYGEAARELQGSKATWATVGATHTIGTQSITATIALNVSASNYGANPRVRYSPNQSFDFHSADGAFGIAYSWPRDRLSSYATKTLLTAHGSLRADRLGEHIAWVEMSQSVQFF
jgi:hypothetical protein